MFEEDDAPPVSLGSKLPGGDSNKLNLGASRFKGLHLTELVRIRDEIRSLLPPTELSKMNLEEEALLQYHTVRSIQQKVLDEAEGIPPNQLAQVANTVASTLNKIIEMQERIYTIERWKAVENLLIRMLKAKGEDWAREWLEEYERLLAGYASIDKIED